MFRVQDGPLDSAKRVILVKEVILVYFVWLNTAIHMLNQDLLILSTLTPRDNLLLKDYKTTNHQFNVTRHPEE
jgi:hypothetical protein